MDLSAMFGRWLRRWQGEIDTRRGVDAADMGTAFGLEVSLLEFDPSECPDEPTLEPWRSTPTPR